MQSLSLAREPWYLCILEEIAFWNTLWNQGIINDKNRACSYPSMTNQ